MGKRNRAKFLQPKSSPPQPYPSPPDGVPYSTGTSISSEPKLSQSIDPTEPLHQIASHNMTEASMKLPHFNPSIPRHNYALSRSLFMKQAQHQHYGHQYARRRSNNHASTSGPCVKGVLPVHDEKLPFKLPSQTIAEMQYQAERLLNPDSRIRFNPMEMETIPAHIPDPSKLASCIICHKSLRRKPGSGATLSSSDVSVVAVLVCGHLYHAQCLEQHTCQEHLHDPPCPLCSGMLAGASTTSLDA